MALRLSPEYLCDKQFGSCKHGDEPHPARNYTMSFVRFANLQPRKQYSYKVRCGAAAAAWSLLFTIRLAIHILVGKETGASTLLIKAHSPKARLAGAPSILPASLARVACHEGVFFESQALLRSTLRRPNGVFMSRMVGANQ